MASPAFDEGYAHAIAGCPRPAFTPGVTAFDPVFAAFDGQESAYRLTPSKVASLQPAGDCHAQYQPGPTFFVPRRIIYWIIAVAIVILRRAKGAESNRHL